MIRSLPFTPITPIKPITPPVVFTAPQPRQEARREIESNEPPGQDAFNRMLVRQREEARLTHRLREAAQASASDAPAPAKDTTEAGSAGKSAPSEAVRTANRTSVRPEGDADKPAQVDPEAPVDEARHGRKTQGSEADLLARLFKTPPKGLPPKQAPFGPEGPPEDGPSPSPADGSAGPAKIKPAPPDIECPFEPTMSAQATWPTVAASDSTQVLQNRDAGDAKGAQGSVDDLTGAGAGADPWTGTGTAGTDGAAERAAATADGGAASDALAATPAVSTPVDTATPPGTAEASAVPGTPLAAALAGPQAQTGAPAPRQATLEARPGTEAFQMKFSAQVAVWVREGVHEAQLQLNPADMGPVRVAILLEGAAAQINFSAEHALTRQALEQALPSLAGSLTEAGFTLAGGGVFDQPRQPERSVGDERRPGTDSRQSAAGDEADTPAAGAVARPRGVVDLVA